jgi:spore coat protein H
VTKFLRSQSSRLAAGALLSLAASGAALAVEFKPAQMLPGADLFTNGSVRQIQIEMAPAAVESLRREPREYVRATATENGVTYSDVAVHVKGNIGSFRDVDDKPDLTLDFNRFNARQKFHELRRIYLNNSVEDPTYCNELLGSELFRAAGVPAPRVAHAVVTLNGRRLGLYVMKEGFTEDFLGCYFNQVGGNLYEPGEGHDVNQRLKRNSIVAPKQDRAALEALAYAALEPDPAKRWPRLAHTLDVEEFVKFTAMEVMVGHRDGYSLARNNYRVYHDLDSDKMVFFPHGMDQLFGNPTAAWLPHMTGLVAKSVMETTEGRRQYKETFASLFSNVYHAQQLEARVDNVVAGLRPAVTSAEFSAIADEAAHLKERIAKRHISLKEQLTEPERGPLVFTNGIGRLDIWVKNDESASVRMEQEPGPGGLTSLHVHALADSGASWRSHVLLSRGRYRFEGRVKIAGVKPLAFGKFQGAGLRVAGSVRESPNLVGDSDWRALSEEFEVTEGPKEVELICELRASAGDAWFGLDSLKMVQLQ